MIIYNINVPKIENATTADKPATKINNPKEAGDKSWIFEIAGIRDAQVPNKAPLMAKIIETANLLLRILAIYFWNVNVINNHVCSKR